jgi:hypothetical protein
VFFSTYVAMFQEGESTFPKAMTMLDATADANNRNALSLAMALAKKHMGSLGTRDGAFVKDADFMVLSDDNNNSDTYLILSLGHCF